MNSKISSILRSGILAQTIFLASEQPIQAQYTPQHPVISATPKQSSQQNPETLKYLLLGSGAALTAGILYGIKSVMDFAHKKQDELDETLIWRERIALKKKLSNNSKLRTTIETILKNRGGVDPEIYK